MIGSRFWLAVVLVGLAAAPALAVDQLVGIPLDTPGLPGGNGGSSGSSVKLTFDVPSSTTWGTTPVAGDPNDERGLGGPSTGQSGMSPQDGSMKVVPEPSSSALLACVCVFLLALWHWRSRRRVCG